MPNEVRVLVVDDSAYMRVVLRDMLQSELGLTVVGTAKNGLDAIEKVKELEPDVVVLDIQMPKMDGIATLQKIMTEKPTKVVMLSAMDKVDDQLPLKALSLGAVDFIPKPSGPVSIDIVRFRADIGEKIRTAANASLDVLKKLRAPIKVEPLKMRHPPQKGAKSKAVVIAASTGGPRALESIFAALPADLPASIFIVQHIPAEFSRSFAKRLGSARGPEVIVASDGARVEKGKAYLAPGGIHLKLERGTGSSIITRLDDSKPVQFVKPSANILFESAVDCYESNVLAVILTGMGSDGTKGAASVRTAGGTVIAQDENSSVVFGMAKAAAAAEVVDEMLPLDQIPARVMRFLENG